MALEGHATLAKMAENSLKLTNFSLHIVVNKHLLRKNCIVTVALRTVAQRSTVWQWARSVHDVISPHTTASISRKIPTFLDFEIIELGSNFVVTHRQTDRQTDRHTDTNTYTN